MGRSAIRWIGIFAGGVVLIGSAGILLLGRGATPKRLPVRETGPRGLYRAYCAQCHGETGRGDGPDSRFFLRPLPDLANRETMEKVTDQYLALIIRNGGDLLGKPGMPAFRTLTDAEVQALVQYLRHLSGSAPPSVEKAR